jgi:cell pole-organizing protein PopZ
MAAARLADAWSAARRTFSGARGQAQRFGGTVFSEGANSEPHMTQAGAKAGQEPTMEDILASIRRIIAEDYAAQAAPQAAQTVPMPPQQHQVARPQLSQSQPRPAAAADALDLNARADRFRPPMPEVVAVPPPVAPLPMPRVVSNVAPAAMAAAPMLNGNAARAVSEFSERLGRSFSAAERYQREALSAEPVAAAIEQAATPAPAPVTPESAPQPVASATVEAVAAAVQSHLAAAIQAAHRTEPQRAPEPPKPVETVKEAPVSLRPEPASLRTTFDARAAQIAREQAAQPTEKLRESAYQSDPVLKNDPPPAWLVSPRTTNAVAGSFKALQDNKQAPAAAPLTDVQSGALQELMIAALRPMLKDWLDQNLPSMVERMITAEIQRVTRGE